MITAGRTTATEARAAQLAGMALGTFRNKREWQRLSAALTSRHEAKVRIYDEERLRAVLAGQDVVREQHQDADDDLLDIEEARLSIPEDRRPTPKTWKTYISDGTGPRSDKRVAGVPHWYRRTVLVWLDRPVRVGGRPLGSTDTRPRDLSGDPRHLLAEERRARVRTLLAVRPEPSRQDVTELAAALGVSARHAERLVAEARAA